VAGNAPSSLPLDSAVITPTNGAVITTTTFSIEGQAYAERSLHTLTVHVNGAPFYTTGWPAPPAAAATTKAPWSTTFTAPGEGHYTFLSSVDDWAGGVQTSTHPVTVTVDLLPPSPPTFDTTVITTAHRASLGVAVLSGRVTDTIGVQRVNVNPDHRGWGSASLNGRTWRFLWTIGNSDPDGVTYDVTARATDFGGHSSETSTPILFDMQPPAPVTVTLSYFDPVGERHPLEPHQTITDGNLLMIEWTPGHDGSGVAGSYVGWTDSPTDTTGLPFIPQGTVYSATQLIGEAQEVYAHLITVDLYGNRREQTLGPVYVDGPLTPDLIDTRQPPTPLYHGWMDSGCTQLGLDRRVAERAPNGASLSENQAFYATWDDRALRLSWVGANWDAEGDLFVYLDTQPGGATTLYDPYTSTVSNTTIYLPGNLPPAPDMSGWPVFEKARQNQAVAPFVGSPMQADYLVWVRDHSTATLLRWDGNDWVVSHQLPVASRQSPVIRHQSPVAGRQSPVASHQSSVVRRPSPVAGHRSPVTGNQTFAGIRDTQHPPRNTQHVSRITDLYLPFDLLGIGDPAATPLTLLAVASDENALRLWATMPEQNPVDSARVVGPLAEAAPAHIFALTKAYHFPSLGGGLCPSALTRFKNSDVRAELSVTPPGTAYRLHGDDLFWQWQTLFQGAGPRSAQFTFLDHTHPPLKQGQTITYTLRLSNRGLLPATDVKVLLSAYYALHLPGSTEDNSGYREYRTLDVGAIAPGATAVVTFTGTVAGESGWRYDRCRNGDGLPAEVCQRLLDWATLDAQVFDSRTPLALSQGLASRPPLEWLWVDHAVDNGSPPTVGIQAPLTTVRPGANTVSGYAFDPSGVPLVEVQVRDGAGTITTLTCPDSAPDDGQWACPWTVTGNDGDTFDLRARATDGYGHVSDWTTPWRPVVVDSTAPTVTLTSGLSSAAGGQGGSIVLTGAITDSHTSGAVEVCHTVGGGTACDTATTIMGTQPLPTTMGIHTAAVQTATYDYDDVPVAPVTVGGGTEYCPGGEITRTFSVSDTFVVGDVNLGFDIVHPDREELMIDLISPAGTRARVVTPRGAGFRFANYDVWLDDVAGASAHGLSDDDASEPYFDRRAHPDAALSVFRGEVASGVWQLRICDLLPAVNEGKYQRGRLSLTPQNASLAQTGSWTYALALPTTGDGVTETVSIYGLDDLGNRTAEPLTVTYRVDVVPPVLEATPVISYVNELTPVLALTGRVSDGGGVDEVYVAVQPPEGAPYLEAVTRDGADWSYTLRPDTWGTYTLGVEAYDRAGNVSARGPFAVGVVRSHYLPLLLNRYVAPPAGRESHATFLPFVAHAFAPAPDLVIDHLVATSRAVTVTVRNAGELPVNDAFWVDVYFSPTESPTVNKPWHTIAANGVVWGVTTPVSAGGVLTLTTGGADYFPQYSSSPPYPVGAQVYALVDSVDFSTSYGAVWESNEANNLFGPVISTSGVGDTSSPTVGASVPPDRRLPWRGEIGRAFQSFIISLPGNWKLRATGAKPPSGAG